MDGICSAIAKTIHTMADRGLDIQYDGRALSKSAGLCLCWPLWAAWYITRLLVKLTPKGVVFLFFSLCWPGFMAPQS